jgi:hypothetical protein
MSDKSKEASLVGNLAGLVSILAPFFAGRAALQ